MSQYFIIYSRLKVKFLQNHIDHKQKIMILVGKLSVII